MAVKTSKKLRSQVMYSVFVRNHSEEGNFAGVQRDLDRIKELGTDIVWLLPIHPIGKKERKGELGSPYAISDYRAINPEYGTMEDFKELVDAIHERGMKCIIDVVYNHTSPDSWLVENHPEWFYKKENGCFGNKVGEWLDVVDLDYNQLGLWDYQIETLKQWAEIVDGFRCDVAPLIPLEFWLKAREEVSKINPDCIWLSESVEAVFTIDNRARGMVSLSDSEIFQAFDMCYEYDVYCYFKGYLQGNNSLKEYIDMVKLQEAIYPDNYVKLRFLENHDNTRAHYLIPDKKSLINWTAFMYFQKGMTLIYAGQEAGCKHLPSLFDKDLIQWKEDKELEELMQTLYKLKKHPLLVDSRYEVRALPHEIIYATHQKNDSVLAGVFCTQGEKALVYIDVPEGIYVNLLNGKEFEIHRGQISVEGMPIVFEYRR